MEKMEGKLKAVGGYVDDLVDDFHPGDAVEYPQDFVAEASADEWALLRYELEDLQGANPEALHWAMLLHLDQDVAQVWHSCLVSVETFNGQDPFKLANMQLWLGSSRAGSLEKAIVANKKFQEAQERFYKLGG